MVVKKLDGIKNRFCGLSKLLSYCSALAQNPFDNDCLNLMLDHSIIELELRFDENSAQNVFEFLS